MDIDKSEIWKYNYLKITSLIQDGVYRSPKIGETNLGYGPMCPEDFQDVQENRKLQREKEKLEKAQREYKRRNNRCTQDGCSGLAIYEGTDFCDFHRREEKEGEYIIKKTLDTVASFIPGYSQAKAVAGAVSWVAGAVTDYQSARDFGGSAVKDELGGKLCEWSGKIVADGPVSPEIAGQIGGFAYSATGALGSVAGY